jgi:hypothetical protein
MSPSPSASKINFFNKESTRFQLYFQNGFSRMMGGRKEEKEEREKRKKERERGEKRKRE